MRQQAVALCLTFLSLTAAQSLHAEPQTSAAPPTAAGVAKQSSREVVQQKLQLVKMLLTQSTAIDRASRSDDPAVKKQATEVLALYAKANNAFDAGDTAESEKMLDEVLSMIADTSRRAPDPVKVEAEQRARYEELLDSVRGIQITYQEMRKDMSPGDKQLPVVNANLERNLSLIDKVQVLAEKKQYREAISQLESGYAAGIADLNKLMDSVTSTYEAKFNTPAEEFDHELARYRSYEELVPIALVELKPNEGSIKMSERLVQQSQASRDTAKQQAASGDYQTAIATMHEATKRMQSALKTLGLMVPE